MIETGKAAPAFTLDASTGGKVKLSDYRGRNVVLYFYPKDNTPGCTTEAIDFQAALADFETANTVVLGVSKDSIASHCNFADEHSLHFPLLSDPTGKVLEKYGAWGEKSSYGRKTIGVIRTTVIIDAKGKIAHIMPAIRLKGHVAKVLAAVRELA